MGSPMVIDDKMIHSPITGTNSISNIRPGKEGWHVPINSPKKPEVTIVLSDKPVNVQDLTMTGNASSRRVSF